jgi:thiamine biosynthesis lipoprotein
MLTLGFYSTYKNKTKDSSAKPNLPNMSEVHFTRFYMDTYIELIVLHKDKQIADKATEEAFAVFDRLDKKYNYYKADSYLSRINRNEITEIDDPETVKILNSGLQFSKITGGAFDMTLGTVKDLYTFGKENPIPPTDEAIKKALSVSGYTKLKIDGNKIDKPEGMKIDPGGILKGYAVDEAVDSLKKNGIENALVNAGGNIRVLGKNTKGETWKIGVENPRAQGDIISLIPLDNLAVATSGDYQRYFFYRGKRYHHILDPSTGKPADKVFSTTITAPEAIITDAYSTAVFVMGKKKGFEFLKSQKLEGMIVDSEGMESTITNSNSPRR